MRATILFILCACTIASAAYQPLPVQRSAGERETQALLNEAATDSAKVAIARESLKKFGSEIAVGKLIIDLLLKNLEDPIAFFRSRLEQDSLSAANHYFYGRASRDSTIMAEEAQWILRHDPGNYWGFELAGYAEWHRSKPDTAVLIANFQQAISADPSRPDAYLYLGWVYWDEERWSEAREVLEAGAVADPSDKSIRDARLTVYAEQRDADAFFDLMQGVFSDQPLEADLPRARGGANVTSADLRGAPTVIEYWAYT